MQNQDIILKQQNKILELLLSQNSLDQENEKIKQADDNDD